MRHLASRCGSILLTTVLVGLLVAPGCDSVEPPPDQKQQAASPVSPTPDESGQAVPEGNSSPEPPPVEIGPPPTELPPPTGSWPTGSQTPQPQPQASPAPVAPAVPSPAAPAGNVQLSAGVALPQTGPTGILMSFGIDYEFAQGGPDPNVQYGWIIQRRQGQPAAVPVKLKNKGTLQTMAPGWEPREGPFQCYLIELRSDGTRRQISQPADLSTVGEG
ncbi:MAG: hypothetical protein JW818_10905 [Pirellulales bacterium]|nr:hypothetical protein [Pirellulales bacterium]